MKEYIKIKDINEYISKSINPAKKPDTIFEMYSVPAFETKHPEYLLGSEMASSKSIFEKKDILGIGGSLAHAQLKKIAEYVVANFTVR